MKNLIVVMLAVSLNTFAGVLNVDCGTIKKVKETRKNPLPGVVLKVLTPGLRMSALKVKLRDAVNYTVNGDFIASAQMVKRTKQKRAYGSNDNYDKHLKLLNEALELQESSSRDVYVCYGEVKGLDRWHKIASYSTVSRDDALEDLIKKYR